MTDIRNYALVTGAYWGFTLTDGALRMLVLLHFHQLGYAPLQIAFLFLLYEFFGVVTNLVGGWIGSRLGLKITLFAGLALRRQYLKLLMGAVLHMDDEGWRRLTWRWAFFFLVLAALNEVVWRNVSTDTWVAFKTFGIIPLTLAFGLAQVPLLTKHQIEEDGAGG